MKYLANSIFFVFYLTFVMGSLNFYKRGWLDRVVSYHKKKFVQDLKDAAPIQINATIKRAPPGYVDSKSWDYDSVVRLLTLIRQSETAKPVRRMLRRVLAPTRRIYQQALTKEDSFKLIPSLIKHDPRNFYYYDYGPSYEYVETKEEDPGFIKTPLSGHDNSLIVVSNPVEAKLPAAHISINLLKEILEGRAEAARIMPSTTKAPFLWIPMSSKSEGKVTDTTTVATAEDKDVTGVTTLQPEGAPVTGEGNATTVTT